MQTRAHFVDSKARSKVIDGAGGQPYHDGFAHFSCMQSVQSVAAVSCTAHLHEQCRFTNHILQSTNHILQSHDQSVTLQNYQAFDLNFSFIDSDSDSLRIMLACLPAGRSPGPLSSALTGCPSPCRRHRKPRKSRS